jgi:hypothetical protein
MTCQGSLINASIYSLLLLLTLANYLEGKRNVLILLSVHWSCFHLFSGFLSLELKKTRVMDLADRVEYFTVHSIRDFGLVEM